MRRRKPKWCWSVLIESGGVTSLFGTVPVGSPPLETRTTIRAALGRCTSTRICKVDVLAPPVPSPNAALEPGQRRVLGLTTRHKTAEAVQGAEVAEARPGADAERNPSFRVSYFLVWVHIRVRSRIKPYIFLIFNASESLGGNQTLLNPDGGGGGAFDIQNAGIPLRMRVYVVSFEINRATVNCIVNCLNIPFSVRLGLLDEMHWPTF